MISRKVICVCVMSIVLGLPLAACESGSAGPATPAAPSATAAAGLTASGGTGTATGGPEATIPAPTSVPTAPLTAGPTAGSPATATLPIPATPAGPAAPTMPATPAATEQPLAPEQNPVGDIPDSQVFVQYRSPDGGYELAVPEGWGRSRSGTGVRFVDKLDGVDVQITATTSAPTAATARAHEVAALIQAGRAVQVGQVQDVTLPAGPAVLIEYTSNSDPNAVTNKQVRLDNNRYLFYKNGKVAALTLWAPSGADNVDQWLQMARSFRWVP